MLAEWELCRPSGLGGGQVLPDPGGTQQQAIAMMEAFQILEAAFAELTAKGDA